MQILISGGGTGGHIFPAISLAQEFKATFPEISILFVGTQRGLEKTIVPQYKFPITFLNVKGIKNHSFLYRISAFWLLFSAIYQAFKIILRFKPDMVFGVGGYASAPCIIAAFILRKPIFLLEQNSVPGITNRFLQPFAKKIFLTFDHARPYFTRTECITSGNPIRKEFYQNTPISKKENPGFPEKKSIVIVGGSQGAKPLNDFFKSLIRLTASNHPEIYWTHQTGKAQFDEISRFYESENLRNVQCLPFIEAAVQTYKQADLIISRSGASTVSEIFAVKKPSILIPLPSAADNHQYFNAKELADLELAEVIEQKQLDIDLVMDHILDYLFNRERINKIEMKFAQLGTRNSAEIIIKESLAAIKYRS